MEKDLDRRKFLKAASAVGIGVGFAGCSGSGKSEIEQQLDSVREATKKYDGDIQAARDDGYVQLDGPGVPGMGWHLVNPDLIKDAVKNGFSVESPTALTFDSDKNLGSVEYTAPSDQVSQSPDLFADNNVDYNETWTTHVEATHIISVEPYDELTPMKEIPFEKLYKQQNWKEMGELRTEIEPGDEVTMRFPGHEEEETRVVDAAPEHPTLQSLHAWVHVENPDGMFAEVNPNFAQDLASTNHRHE